MRFEQWLYTIPLRLRSLFRRKQLDHELDEELKFHLDLRIEQEIASGKTADAARCAALRAMEGLEQEKERCRDTRKMNLIADVRRNLQYASRALKHSPAFAVVAVTTLALGIGANTAIFSLVDAVLLKMLPVKAPAQLYFIGHNPEQVSVTWNYADYRAMRDHNTVFTGLAGYSLNLEPIGIQTNSAAAAQLSYGIFVSGNYFDVLGVSAAYGRVFNAADDRAPGAAPYVVIGYSYWQSHFNRDKQAIGRKLILNGYPFTIIGIAPPRFVGADVAFRPDLFIPIMMRSEIKHVTFASWNDRHSWWMAAIGRLRQSARVKDGEGELFAIYRDQGLAESRSSSNLNSANTTERIVLVPAARGFSYLTDQLKKPLLILFSVVALVLLIACLNVANLMLARGATRQRETAVRLAMGASRWRVISQLITESMLIAFSGGALGVAVAFVGIRFLLQFMPHVGYELPTIDARLDWRALAFTFTACVLTSLLFGIVPAWQSTHPDLVSALKQDLPGSTETGRTALRKALVILQVALSLPLLTGASLFGRTLANLRDLNTGFSRENVFIASVDPTTFGYKDQRVLAFYNQLCARIGSLPGVRAASLALITPLTGSSWNGSVSIEGYAWKPDERNNVFYDAVGPRYFETLGTPVILGRDFTDLDNPTTAIELPDHPTPGTTLADPPGRHVAVVNEKFARRFFGEHSPLGRHVLMGGPFRTKSPYEIVGVVKDARYFTMRGGSEPMMFVPVWRRFAGQAEVVIRTSGATPQLASEVRRQIQELNPEVPLLNLGTLGHDVDENILVERLVATLSGLFGLLAVLLSALGMYGVIAYTVTRRTREIGIRIAIGAERASVLWLVFEEAMVMVLVGGVIGVFAALLATRAIASILYGVSANDITSIAAAGFCLTIAAISAAFLPARRASKIQPSAALRYE